jgi:hypothetical protein
VEQWISGSVEQNSDQWNSALTGLTEVVFHKVVTEVKVIATTVGGGMGELTHCIGLPTDLPIRCAVAERFTKNGESCEDFLQTLHADFESKNISERANVFQKISRVKIHDSSNSMTTVSRPQPDTCTLPSLVRSTAPRSQPHVSPKPGRTEKNDSNSYEEVKPAWFSNLKQEFADPSLLLNKQLSEVHSEYVIPVIPSNLQPQIKKFVTHKRTEMDMKHVYEEVDPKWEWNSHPRKFERSANCKSHEDPQTASGKSSEIKFIAIITTGDNYDIRSIQILAKLD